MGPKRKRALGTRRRGAAMVEAAAVMPVLVIFYGLTIFVYKQYDMKQSLIEESRHEAFSSALHMCMTGHEYDAATLALDSVAPYAAINAYANVPYVVNGDGVGTFLTERGMKTLATSTGVASNEALSNVVRTRRLSAISQVYCVPQQMDEVAQSGATWRGTTRDTALPLSFAIMGPIIAYLRGQLP